ALPPGTLPGSVDGMSVTPTLAVLCEKPSGFDRTNARPPWRMAPRRQRIGGGGRTSGIAAGDHARDARDRPLVGPIAAVAACGGSVANDQAGGFCPARVLACGLSEPSAADRSRTNHLAAVYRCADDRAAGPAAAR